MGLLRSAAVHLPTEQIAGPRQRRLEPGAPSAQAPRTGDPANTPGNFNAPSREAQHEAGRRSDRDFSQSEFPSATAVPSLPSAFHKHPHRPVLLAQAESSFQSCVNKSLGKPNLKPALGERSCRAGRGAQPVRRGSHITGWTKARGGKLLIRATAFKKSQILPPRSTYHKVTAASRLGRRQAEAAAAGGIRCAGSSAVAEQ